MQPLTELTRSPATHDFTATGSFTLLADGLQGDEKIYLQRKGPSGGYLNAGNNSGWITLGSSANTVVINVTGEIEWRLVKNETKAAVSVGLSV